MYGLPHSPQNVKHQIIAIFDMNHFFMSYTKTIGILALVVIGFFANAQPKPNSPKTDTVEKTIWLYNSKGEIITENGTRVMKSFFSAEKVMVLNKNRWMKGDDMTVLIFPPNAKAMGIGYKTPLVMAELKEKLQNYPIGTRVIFGLKNNDERLSLEIILDEPKEKTPR
jgi:hypothetical protein